MTHPTASAKDNGGQPGGRWRLAAWGAAAALLLLPLVAMQFTDEVDWDLADFAFAGVLVAGVGATYELAVRRTPSRTYRAAAAVALAAAFLLMWANAAVGVIGSEDNPANRMFPGVVAVGIVGALLARFRPHGMAYALLATAFAQVLAVGVALGTGLGSAGWVTVFFTTLWLLSAALFRKAASEQADRAAQLR